jgi:hypothetical protein
MELSLLLVVIPCQQLPLQVQSTRSDDAPRKESLMAITLATTVNFYSLWLEQQPRPRELAEAQQQLVWQLQLLRRMLGREVSATKW